MSKEAAANEDNMKNKNKINKKDQWKLKKRL